MVRRLAVFSLQNWFFILNRSLTLHFFYKRCIVAYELNTFTQTNTYPYNNKGELAHLCKCVILIISYNSSICVACPVDIFIKVWCNFLLHSTIVFIFLSVLNFSFCLGLFFSFFFLLIVYECFVTITCACKNEIKIVTKKKKNNNTHV